MRCNGDRIISLWEMTCDSFPKGTNKELLLLLLESIIIIIIITIITV